jgi:hypothetical protein
MVYHNKNKIINIRFYLLSKIQAFHLKNFIYFWSFFNNYNILISVKNKKKLFTVVKSPNIFKKSKQHFYVTFYLLDFNIKIINFNVLYQMLAYILNKTDFLKIRIFIIS